jgi:DNA polymerase elongation subunit (family B)
MKETFLSLTSPFKEIASAEEKKNIAAALHSKSKRVKFFNSDSIQEKYIWKDLGIPLGKKDAPIPATTSSSIPETSEKGTEENPNVYITSTGVKIQGNVDAAVLEVLEGLNEEDFLLSQANTPINQKPPTPVTVPPLVRKNTKIPDISKKMSTCELEIDTHAIYVVNARMKKLKFGADLWEEERIRCERKGLPFDSSPNLPSTQTMKRTQQQTELDFYQRFERLQLKGAALRKTTKEILYTQKEVQKGLALSQYLTADDKLSETVPKKPTSTSIFSKTNPPVEVLDEAISQWVSATIDQAKKDAVEIEETFQQVCGDPDSLIEDYIKSQRTPTRINNENIADAANLKFFVSELNPDLQENREEEDNETQDSIDREVDDILTSTQLEPSEATTSTQAKDKTRKLLPIFSADEEELVKSRLKESLPFDSPFAKPPLIPMKSALSIPENSEEDYFYYSTPPDPSSTKASGIAFVDETKIQQPSMQQSSSSEIFLPDSLVGKRRATDNKLTSVFKKPKPSRGSPSEKNISSMSKSVKWKEDEEVPGPTVSKLFESPSSSEGSYPQTTPLMGILSKSNEKTSETETFAEKKKYKKSVSFLSTAANMNINPLSSIIPDTSTNSSSSFADIINLSQEAKKFNKAENEKKVEVTNIPTIDLMHDLPEFMGTKPLYLVPTFAPPKPTELVSLETFGKSLVINPIPRFTHFPDTKELQKNAENQNADYNYYMSSSHNVVYEKDVAKFSTFYRESDSLEEVSKNKKKEFKKTFMKLPSKSRCLVPTYDPPKPLKFWKKFEKSQQLLKIRTVAPSSTTANKIVPTSPGSIPATGVSTIVDSTQSSDPQEYLLGASTENQDKMSRIVILSMELHCKTRKELLANPKHDPIDIIVWIADDIISNAENEQRTKTAGILLVINAAHQKSTFSLQEKDNLLKEITMNIHTFSILSTISKSQVHVFPTELEMIQAFCYISREIIDPDFLIGYESTNNSYGYLIKRGKIIGLDVLQLLSRVPQEKPSFRNAIVRAEMKENNPELFANEEAEDFHDLNSVQADVGIFIKGRTFLNTWHLLKSELKMWNCTLHYAVESILQKTLPHFTPAQLTKWYQTPHTRYKAVSHIYLLSLCNLLLIEKLDIVRKISECARLYGIDFFSVFHRGSQYRVEAAVIVKAHANDFLLISPSKTRVANQAAMEVIPLVLEPKSHFYTDPVLVLDYQSLYPSMILAYNLCYSTCMGKLKTGVVNPNSGRPAPNSNVPAETTGRLGVINYPEPISAINSTLHVKNIEKYLGSLAQSNSSAVNSRKLDEHTPYVSPNGTIFCAKSVRHGILPMIIREMLDTRLMVKRAMKKHAKLSADGKKHNKVLEKVLDARQLAIKMLANVTCKSHYIFFLGFLI